MDTSIILANAWGIPLVVIALAFLVNPRQIKVFFSMFENETNVFVFGFVCLIVGVITLQFNNIWAPSWKTILTVLGWISVLRGCLNMFWTQGMVAFCNKTKENEYLSYVILAIFFLGLILIYFGIPAGA